MYRSIAMAVIIAISLTACQSKSAFDYNQRLVKIEKSLVPDIERTENLVMQYAQSGDYDSVAAVSTKMAGLVHQKLTEVKDIPAPNVKQGDTFKNAYVKYFEYMESLYLSYKNFAVEQTEEGRERERQNMMKLVEKKDEVIRNLQEVQRDYAKANGFKMEK